MRAAIYTRVSGEHQVNNTSLPNQLERSRAYVQAQGWELVVTFTEPGETAENLDRPALTAARAAARQGKFDVLVVYTLDRLTRDIDDLFLLRRELLSLDVRTWAVHDGLDITTANIDDLLAVLFKGYFGHRELATTRRRTMEGIESHLRAGKFPGGRPPYGYRRGDDDRLTVYEPEAQIVRLMYQWIVGEGLSAHAVSRRLNSLSIPGPSVGRKGREGVSGRWFHGTVTLMIRSETYAGTWTYGKRGDASPLHVQTQVLPIVDRETWERAQDALTGNYKNTRPPKHDYMLRGLIKCECGASYCAMHPSRPGGPWWYHCTARYDYRKLSRAARCDSVTVRGPELEAAVWSDIVEFVRQPHLVAAELSRRREPVGESIAARLAEVDRAIAERKAERGRYLSLYGRGIIPIEELEAKSHDVQSGLAALEVYRAGLIEEQRRSDLWEREMSGVMEALASLGERLKAGVMFADKRAIVEMLVKSIVVETRTGEDGVRFPVAHVTYRFEHPDVAESPIPAELTPLFAEVCNWTVRQVALY